MAKAAKLIKVCCALHNFIIENGCEMDDFELEDDDYDDESDDSPSSSSDDHDDEGEARRNRRPMSTRDKFLMRFLK